jgi:hypothetical protein
MHLSLSREAASHLATQEFLNILWNLKVDYHVRKNSPLVSIPEPEELGQYHFIILHKLRKLNS